MTRILVVDDKEENLYYLDALLRAHGWAVETARHGAEALAKARRDPPDLVVSDLLMPVMDGYTLLRHWKTDPRLRRAPFIVYTATYTEPEDERLALGLGADAFILKPAEPEDFVARIRAVLAAAAGDGAPPPRQPASDPEGLLKTYSETLIRKLEEKMLQLEATNQALQRDIAERQRAEEKLRQSEERFRELAETIQEVFWITDADKRQVLYVSPAYERVWGRTCASLYAAPRSWQEAIHPEDRSRVAAARHLQARGDYDETYRILRPDGSVRWVRDRAFPVFGAHGEVRRIVGTAEDVTKRRQLEEQIRQAQKMEAIGHLAGGVAHDFNNILAAIVGNVQLALSDTAEDHPARASLEEVFRACTRARMLVQQILTFSSQQPRARRVIALGPVVEETVSFLRATMPAAVEVALTLDPDAPPVLADPTQVHQVVANLCTNAWQALDDQPGRIEVSLRPVVVDAAAASHLAGLRPGPATCLTVSDTGAGMEAATLERMFEPFFTTKELGKGTGMGLAVVHGIVQGHDAAIAVRSQPGRGTTFEVYFPAAPAAVPAAPPPTAVAPQGDGQHILYIDDEEPLVQLATRMLERLGYRISAFTSTDEAVRAFREDPHRFDLVIADLNMPGASGLHVAAELLALRPDLPIALCSGHVTEDLKQRAREAGLREVLYKPNTMQELGDAIHRLAVSARDS